MTFTLEDWIIYTLWGIFGLMIIDFLVAFIKTFWAGTFRTTFLGYLKDVLYYVVPLYFILTFRPIDPTGWILVIVFFLGGVSVMIKYIGDIIGRFRK